MSGVLVVAAGQLVPHQNHRYATCQPDQDHPGHVFGSIMQKQHRQTKHQQRPNQPVLQQ